MEASFIPFEIKIYNGTREKDNDPHQWLALIRPIFELPGLRQRRQRLFVILYGSIVRHGHKLIGEHPVRIFLSQSKSTGQLEKLDNGQLTRKEQR